MLLRTVGKVSKQNVFVSENGMKKQERQEDYPPLVLIISESFPTPPSKSVSLLAMQTLPMIDT